MNNNNSNTIEAPPFIPPNASLMTFSTLRNSLNSSTTNNKIQRLALLEYKDHKDEEAEDHQRLYKALQEAGEHSASGSVAAVEVYRYQEKKGHLELLNTWCKQSKKEEYTPPPSEPVIPGTDLVGTLWSSLTTKGEKRAERTRSSRRSTVIKKAADPEPATLIEKQDEEANVDNKKMEGNPIVNSSTSNKIHNHGHLCWRELVALQSDPDTWTGPIVQYHLDLDHTLAAGVTFQCDGVRGLVVYYASDKNQDKDKNSNLLYSVPNTIYLQRCATYIGSIVAMTEARRACAAFAAANQTQPQEENVAPRTPSKVNETDAADATTNTVPMPNSDHCGMIVTRLVAWYHKCWGSGLQIPPPMPLPQVAWTLVGSFCGMLLLSLLNEGFVHLTDGEYALVIGPFGAMMTLMYALPSAPASQPRNAILGEAVAGSVAMAFSYLPLPQWFRRALCPALGISAMTALGVVHPPAGAHATVWADAQHDWYFFAIVVLGAIVSVLPATIINNLSTKRQYPMYWGYLPKWCYDKIWKEE